MGDRSEPRSAANTPDGMRTTLSRRRLIMVMAGVMLGMLLGALDQTIVGTAMPRVIAELNGLEHYAWTFTAYMLASTVAVPIWGKLSDIYGRRPFFMGGMVLFLLGSALAGTSQDMTQLIIYRGIQGLGGGAMMPIVQAIIGDIFTPVERGKWQGVMMAVFGLASIIGPTAGGWITDNWGWRWVFYVNMPVGALALLTAGFALPGRSSRNQHQIDYLGAAALVAGAVPLLLAFTWAGSQYPWASAQIEGLFALAALMFGVFLVIEGRAAEPIMSLSLFRNSIFTVSVIASFLISVGMFGAIMYLPLFVQGVIGGSATDAGAVLTPMMLGFIASSMVGGQILSRTGRYKVLAIVGFAIATFGMVLLARMDSGANSGLVVRNMVITGLGMGVMMSLFTIVVQNAFPFRQLGEVTATLQFFRSIGGSIGVAVLGTIMTNGFQSAFQGNIPAALRQAVPPGQLAMLQNPEVLLSPEATSKLQAGFTTFGPAGEALFQQLMATTRTSLATAISSVFLMGAGAIALALVSTLFLREIPLRKTRGEEPEAPARQQDGIPLEGARATNGKKPMRMAAVTVATAVAAIALVALVGFPRGTMVAQMEWHNGTGPKANLKWIADRADGADAAPAPPVDIAVGGQDNSAAINVTAESTPVNSRSGERPATPAATPAADAASTAVSTAVPNPAPGGREYVVQPGDTLSSIAARAYGDAREWQRVVATNAGLAANPDLIRVGDKLLLPAS